jgi:hypothetical protein
LWKEEVGAYSKRTGVGEQNMKAIFAVICVSVVSLSRTNYGPSAGTKSSMNRVIAFGYSPRSKESCYVSKGNVTYICHWMIR